MAMPFVVLRILVMTVTVLMVMAAVLVLVMGHILVVVPIVSDEVHRPTTGMVLGAMLAPVFLVARWNMQIDRRG